MGKLTPSHNRMDMNLFITGFAPKGHSKYSPRQRPGIIGQQRIKALKGRSNLVNLRQRPRPASFTSPFQGLGWAAPLRVPGLCPGLALLRPVGAEQDVLCLKLRSYALHTARQLARRLMTPHQRDAIKTDHSANASTRSPLCGTFFPC